MFYVVKNTPGNGWWAELRPNRSLFPGWVRFGRTPRLRSASLTELLASLSTRGKRRSRKTYSPWTTAWLSL